jgi:hypothetical protein
MMTEDFKLGFVEGCLSYNCDKDETEQLFKIAADSQVFDSNENFQKGFRELAGDFDTNQLSLMTKSILLDNAASNFNG